MSKYLWDLEIELIPLGWEETYKDAVETCPNGRIVSEPSNDNDVYRFFYHPVAYRDCILKRFNKEKLEAIKTFESDIDFKTKASKLFKHDLVLYSLLSDWLSSDHDGSSFDPRRIEDQFPDIEHYFSDYIYPKGIEKFIPLKFISFSD